MMRRVAGPGRIVLRKRKQRDKCSGQGRDQKYGERQKSGPHCEPRRNYDDPIVRSVH